MSASVGLEHRRRQLKIYQKQWIETVGDFIGLWDRFDALYLQGIAPDEVTDEKEDAFLEFQGAIVEQLVKVEPVDHERFGVRDLVMAVLHDALSLRHLARQSEFQQRRLHGRWTEASEALSKLRHFCETYSPKFDKASRLVRVRRANPFWDPAAGAFRATLTKIALGPVTFFAGLRPGPDKKMNMFLFKSVITPSLFVFLVLAIAHLETVQQMAYNFTLTTGVLLEKEGVVPKLVIHFFALFGVGILALVTSGVLMLLVWLHAGTLHVASKLLGGTEDLRMTRKIVVYGWAPLVALVTAPYAIVLQIIGVNKAQKVSPVLAVLAWLVGTALLVALVIGILFAAYRVTGQIPYVEVTAVGAKTYERDSAQPDRARPVGQVDSGKRLGYRGKVKATVRKETVRFYRVALGGKEVLLREEDGAVREYTFSRLVPYVAAVTRDKVLHVVQRLSREIGAEAQ